MPLDQRVDRIPLSSYRMELRWHNFLTLDGIPAEAFNSRLGKRSVLGWVVGQYRAKTDRRSGIVNVSDRTDDARYMLRSTGKVISVSLEMVEIVEGLAGVGADEARGG